MVLDFVSELRDGPLKLELMFTLPLVPFSAIESENYARRERLTYEQLLTLFSSETLITQHIQAQH